MKSHLGRVAAPFALGLFIGCGGDKTPSPEGTGGTAGTSGTGAGGTTTSGGTETSGTDQGGSAARAGESSSGGNASGGNASGGSASGGMGGGGATGGISSAGGSASGGTVSGGSSGSASGGTASGGAGGSAALPPALKWSQEAKSGIVEALWGSGANDIYAVGPSDLLLHSLGKGTWTTQNPGTGANLSGVWGSASDDVFVAVESNVVLHSTGDGMWEHQVLSAGAVYFGVWGLDSETVYLVGPGVTRKTATGWESPAQTVTSGAPVYALWGSSATDLYAATALSNGAVIFHSTGDGKWRAQTTPALGAGNDVVGIDANHIYAAADNNVLFSSGNGTWTAQLTTPTAQKVTALWVAAPDAVYACTQQGFVYRSNGQGTWSEGQDIDPATTTSCLSIWGTSKDDIYLGMGGGIYHGTLP